MIDRLIRCIKTNIFLLFWSMFYKITLSRQYGDSQFYEESNMTTKSEILKKMAQVVEINCVDTAYEYLTNLVDAGMEFPNAENHVLGHFTGVEQEDLVNMYDAQ
jgi:hypothetical protein